MEIIREYYQHGPQCDKKTFTPLNPRGVKTCLDCAGQFDADGKGLAVTSRKFDENYEEWLAAEHPEET